MLDASRGKFSFVVDIKANKPQIAQAVSDSFPVKVLSVKTMIIKGTIKRGGRQRREIKTSPYKKAIVELEKGQKIDLFDITEAPGHEHK